MAHCLWLVAFASPAPARPANAAPPDDDRRTTRLLARFDSLRTALAIPGLAVAIVRDTTVLVARGFNLADREQAVPVTPDTPFNIASVTKPISAIVALRLVERGILDLDRPMHTYQGFPEFCSDARAAGGIFFSDFAPQGDGAAGGIVSTVNDLARFDIALTQGRLISPASMPYGLGWFVVTREGEPLYWHTG